MRLNGVISHLIIGCAGVLAGYLVATGPLGIIPSFAQAPAASGQRSTELFNRVMEDVLGRRLTVRLTEREPGNGRVADLRGQGEKLPPRRVGQQPVRV